ncbi:MAG: methyltransferase domain-containing protein [Rhodoferax sp.]|nr:methyltransferase domain-containing protein [Rhodoferax sp.]MBP9735013.1 methyltransferase domain-containing protein [Rhodoferax sp.]
MAVCAECGFVFNRRFDMSRLAYGEGYDNTQSCSPYFDTYLDHLAHDLVNVQSVRDCTVVEVGCGKGQFLEKLVNIPGSRIIGFGFDPSYIGPESTCSGQAHFRRCYYDDTCSDVQADVVICRHVIEHVPAPLSLLHAIRSALENSPDARVFFETPCVEWILDNRVLWDFFYEHCSLFSVSSIVRAFEETGFTVSKVDHIFGGQYLWLEARVGTAASARTDRGQAVYAQALNYGQCEEAMRQTWKIRMDGLRAEGAVALWGAGAKGATLANLIDPGATLIDCVVDLNPNKQGKFIPGSAHRIVPPAELSSRKIMNALLMNPNYRQENEHLLASSGISTKLVDWSNL